jgi:hypothetical protein
MNSGKRALKVNILQASNLSKREYVNLHLNLFKFLI